MRNRHHNRSNPLNGLRINGENLGRLFTQKIELDGQGVDFYDGTTESAADLEARQWIQCILDDTEPVVKPEEALVVTEILDAIYESARTGKAVHFDETGKKVETR